MKIQPFIVGSGMSGRAIKKALMTIGVNESKFTIQPPVQVNRNQAFTSLAVDSGLSLLCIGSPHGLHTPQILAAQEAGFKHVISDKPAAISIEQLNKLKTVNLEIAILHGFRQMWGPQKVREIIQDGKLGELISIEGIYWQSSAAENAIDPSTRPDKEWKSDPQLAGSYDVYLDLGTHWVDLMMFLAGENANSARRWISYANAISDKRDTHVHLYLEFPNCRSVGSVSKTVHGGNVLKFSVIGTRGTVSWSAYDNPDQVEFSSGNSTTVIRRIPGRYGSQQPSFHGMGWVEGYIEIIHNYLLRMTENAEPNFPTLAENINVLELMLTASEL